MVFAVRSCRTLLSTCCLVALLGCAPDPEVTSQASGSFRDVVGARTIIALLPDRQTSAKMRDAAGAAGYTELDAARLSGLDLSMLTFRMPDRVTAAEAIAELEAAVPASTVGVNHAYRLQQHVGDIHALDYAGAMMDWRAGGCQAQAPIGMIDTGIDTTTPALTGARVQTRAFFDGPAPASRHGTDVASVLTDPSRLRDVTIFGANVFGQQDDEGLVAGADALVRALDWLAEENVQFVNLALAGPYNKLLDLAVARAAERGLILVAAVGNDGPRSQRLYPAGFDQVIAVTAVDAEGRIFRNAVRGPHVDVAAPGVDVLVPSDRGGRFVTGTSIATPFVTARLAADPSLREMRRVSDVRARLAATSAELGPKGRDSTFGYGLALATGICDG